MQKKDVVSSTSPNTLRNTNSNNEFDWIDIEIEPLIFHFTIKSDITKLPGRPKKMPLKQGYLKFWKTRMHYTILEVLQAAQFHKMFRIILSPKTSHKALNCPTRYGILKLV